EARPQLVGASLDQKLDGIGHGVLLLRLCRKAASLVARYPRLRDGTRSDNLSDVRFRDGRGT
ncbi:MAG TPA: hypothetical protein VE527_04990, partial [Reyranella sp.]|nr:hypothetical protein [Reyranella sp.]